MDELFRYIETLFAEYSHTLAGRRCRERMCRQAQARLEYKLAAGLGAATATRQVKEELMAWAEAHQGWRLLYTSRCRRDCWLMCMRWLILGWLFSLPALVLWPGVGLAVSLLAVALVTVAALGAYRSSHLSSGRAGFVDVRRAAARSRRAWQIWAVIMLALYLTVTVTMPWPAAWNIFSIPQVAVRFYTPLLSLFYPLIIRDTQRILERGDVALAARTPTWRLEPQQPPQPQRRMAHG